MIVHSYTQQRGFTHVLRHLKNSKTCSKKELYLLYIVYLKVNGSHVPVQISNFTIKNKSPLSLNICIGIIHYFEKKKKTYMKKLAKTEIGIGLHVIS